MTLTEIATYVEKRKSAKKNSVDLDNEASRKRCYQYYEPCPNLSEKDVDVVNLIEAMSVDDRKELQKAVTTIRRERYRRDYATRKNSYDKRVEKMVKNGEDFKKKMEVGDVVRVKKHSWGTGYMHVIDMSENNFTGRYVYQKMDMRGTNQYRKSGSVTDKMYKFVTEIICKNADVS